MGATAQVIIDRSTNEGVYTNKDIVQGRAIISVTDSVRVSQIQIRFEGIASSAISYNSTTFDNNYVTVTNKHRVISQVVTVFPSKEEKEVFSESEFTLAEGTYEYPFTFTIPMTNMCLDNEGRFGNKDTPDTYSRVQDHGVLKMNGYFTSERKATKIAPTSSHVNVILPPTFSLRNALVYYHVKAILMKPSALSRDIRAYDEFNFMPINVLAPQHSLDDYDIYSDFDFSNKKCNARCYFRFQLKSPYLVAGQPILASLNVGYLKGINSESFTPIYLDHMKVTLKLLTQIRSIERALSYQTMHIIRVPEEICILDREYEKYPIDLSTLKDSLEMEIPNELFACRLPEDVTPSFYTCNITRSYQLSITIRYSFNLSAKAGFMAHLKGNKLNKLTILTEDIQVRNELGPIDLFPTPIAEEPLPLYEESEVHEKAKIDTKT